MSTDNFRPWRTDAQPDAALADHADAQWRDLLAESRRSVAALRELIDRADPRIDLGAQLLRALSEREQGGNDALIAQRLDALERRLDAIEHRLAATPRPMPRAA